jgi:hypothetical protein
MIGFLYIWAFVILAIAMAAALRVGRYSRTVGVLVALFSPWLLVALSCVTTGMPNPATSWFGVPTPAGLLWGPDFIVLALIMWTFFVFPVGQLVIIAVSLVVIFRPPQAHKPRVVESDAVELVERYATRYPDWVAGS